jgi:hypothetical protein
MLDGRNALDREAWEAAGWSYRALGRPNGVVGQGFAGLRSVARGRSPVGG